MTRQKRIVLIVVLVGVVSAAAAATAFALRPHDAATATVERADVVTSAVASGRVVAPSRIEVGVVQGGVVLEVPVKEGDAVQPGALLVRLDDRAELAAVAQARAAVAQARAHRLEVTEGQHARASAALAAATAEVTRARASAERARKLLATGASTAAEAEAAEAALALAAAKSDGAAVDVQVSGDGGSQVLLADAQVDAARAALQAAEARLAQTRVLAQVEATVLRRDVEPGSVAFPGRTLLALGRSGGADGRMEIVVQPDEKNLAVLKEGQAAACLADAYPDAPFSAVVKDISPLVDAGRGTIDVRLTVEDPPAFLRTDMTVSVEITTGVKKDALVVPVDAVRDLATSAPWILVLEGGMAQKAALTLGARSTNVVEVLQGLKAGDVFVTDVKMKPGTRVRAP